MTILDRLAEHAAERTRTSKSLISTEEMRRMALELPAGDFAFENALKSPGMSFICECKKASPSKGLIAPDFPYLDIARAYEEAGADCISYRPLRQDTASCQKGIQGKHILYRCMCGPFGSHAEGQRLYT